MLHWSMSGARCDINMCVNPIDDCMMEIGKFIPAKTINFRKFKIQKQFHLLYVVGYFDFRGKRERE